MNSRPCIEIKALTATYGNRTVLTDIDLTVFERDFLLITGPNGGGKTTLIKHLLGLKKPAAGTITFFRDGKSTDSLTMGYLPQYHRIDKKFPITVYETILSGLGGRKSLWKPFTKAQHEQVKKIIVRMGLEGSEQKAIGELSGGQIQRALLGRAIVSEPEALLLDEPDTYIDQAFRSQLYSLLEEINRRSTIILVSHDINALAPLAKSLVYVNHSLERRLPEERTGRIEAEERKNFTAG